MQKGKDRNNCCIYCGSSDVSFVQDELEPGRRIFTCRQCHAEYPESERQQMSADGGAKAVRKALPEIKSRQAPRVDDIRLSKTGIVFFVGLALAGAALFAYICIDNISFAQVLWRIGDFIHDLLFEPEVPGDLSHHRSTLSPRGFVILLVLTVLLVSAERPIKAFLNKILRKRLK